MLLVIIALMITAVVSREIIHPVFDPTHPTRAAAECQQTILPCAMKLGRLKVSSIGHDTPVHRSALLFAVFVLLYAEVKVFAGVQDWHAKCRDPILRMARRGRLQPLIYA